MGDATPAAAAPPNKRGAPAQLSSTIGQPKKHRRCTHGCCDGIDATIAATVASYTDGVARVERKLFELSVRTQKPIMKVVSIGSNDIRNGRMDESIVENHVMWTVDVDSTRVSLSDINPIDVRLGGIVQVTSRNNGECCTWASAEAASSKKEGFDHYWIIALGEPHRAVYLKFRLVETERTPQLVEKIRAVVWQQRHLTVPSSVAGRKLYTEITTLVADDCFVREEVELVSVSFKMRHVADLLHFAYEADDAMCAEINDALLCDQNRIRFMRRLKETHDRSAIGKPTRKTDDTS